MNVALLPAGARSRPGRARGRRRRLPGDGRRRAAVPRLPGRSGGEAARHGDAGRPARLPERRCWPSPRRFRRPRRATSSPIGCRCGPASARTWSAQEIRKAAVARKTTAPDAAAGVAGAADRGRARPAGAAHVDAGRGGRRRHRARAGRPGRPGRRGRCWRRRRPWPGTNGPRAGPDRSASRLLAELAEADVAFLTGLSAQVAKPAPAGRLRPGAQGAPRRRGNGRKFSVKSTRFSKRAAAGGGVDMDELLIRKMREARDAQAEG